MRVFRLLFPLLALGLLGWSLWAAPNHRRAREAGIDLTGVIYESAQQRADEGEKARALGVALRGYEELLVESPEDVEAMRGLIRNGLTLSAVALGQADLTPVMGAIEEVFRKNREKIDPDGARLQEWMRTWVRLRREHISFLGPAAVNIWMAARGEERGRDELVAYTKKGPFHLEFLTYAIYQLPNWTGVEPIVKLYLEGESLEGRVFAGVTLMVYRRLYGVGDELWERHKGDIGAALVESKSKMRPDPNQDAPRSPGGMTLLGLALYPSDAARRIVARTQPVQHPYLAKVVTLAQCWAGLKPFESIDFESREYSVWLPHYVESYFMGLYLHYAELRRTGKRVSTPMEELVDLGTIHPTTNIRIWANRALAAIHPERSREIHDQLRQAGGLPGVYGIQAFPDLDRVPYLFPALAVPEPGTNALAAVSLLDMDAPPPIMLPR
ncbi:MAG: hypothetical protein AAGD14_07815 [Planctomycetota bacterium]